MNAYNEDCSHESCEIVRCLLCQNPVWTCQVYPSRLRLKSKTGECIPCIKNKNRNWRMENGQESVWRSRGVEDFTVEDYDRMLKEQDGKCAICRELCSSGLALALDHNHATGKKRGLLCRDCNVALSYMKDSPARLLAAAQYLLERDGE